MRSALALLGLACQGAPADAACTLGKYGDLPVTMDGLVPTIPVKINGVDLKMTADSGAVFSLLTPQGAAKAKLKPGALPSGFFSLWTPQGAAKAKLKPLPVGMDEIAGLGGRENVGIATAKDFTILGITFHYAEFLVAAPQLNVDGLIGNNILSQADVEFDLANGVIRFFKPQGCSDQAVLAYWAPTDKVSSVSIEPVAAPNFKILAHVKLNGQDMRAILDSGTGRSFITRAAAKSAGVAITDAGVQRAGIGGGIGRSLYDTWIAPFKSFQIGNEEVKNARLNIGDTELEGVDMLIGADFLLSHRVYVANSEHKLYFTDNGGPVFDPEPAGGPGPAPPQSSQLAPSQHEAGPSIPGAPVDNLTGAGAP